MMLERITSMVRVLVIVFFISLAMLGTTYGATYYVSKSGSNSNSCATAQKPSSSAKLTIAAGAGCLSAGDTLLIQAGTYAEGMDASTGFPWRNGTASAYTRYAKYQNDVVVVQAPSGYFTVYFSGSNQYIELDGLIIDGSHATSAGMKFDDNASFIRLKNSQIRNTPHDWTYTCTTPAGSGGGGMGIISNNNTNNLQFLNNDVHHNGCYGIYFESRDSLIDGNSFHDNGGYGVHAYNGFGPNINNDVIRNNKIYNNGLLATDYNVGIIVSNGSNTQVYNNLIYGNVRGLYLDYSLKNVKVYNNTIYNNGEFCAYIGTGSSGADIRNNICYQNSGGITNNGSGTVVANNLTSNPLFVDAANANFHLQVGSPAIDAGLTISTVTNDYTGTPRPEGAAYDIGAYEYIKGLPHPINFRIVSSK